MKRIDKILDRTPPEVIAAWVIKHSEIVGSKSYSLYQDAVTKYPEYFPDEIAARKRFAVSKGIWQSIPKAKKEFYRYVMHTFTQEYLKADPPPPCPYGKGVFHIAGTEEGRQEYNTYLKWDNPYREARRARMEAEFKLVFKEYLTEEQLSKPLDPFHRIQAEKWSEYNDF